MKIALLFFLSIPAFAQNLTPASAPTNGHCAQWVVSGTIYTLGDTGSACGSAGASFSALTTGTNTTATMTLGTGATLTFSGSGEVNANYLNSVPFCTGFTPTNGQNLEYTTGSSPNPCYTAATVSGGAAFSALTGGTNTAAAMIVGTGASMGVSGSGTIAATTSAALAATPTPCSTGFAPTGVLANGNSTGCAAIDTGGTAAVSNVTAVTVSANVTTDQSLMELPLTSAFFNLAAAPFLVHGSGIMTIGAAQTPTLTFKAKLCTVSGCATGTTIPLASITTTATVAATNNIWVLNLKVATSTTGASGTLLTHGSLAIDIGATSAVADSVFNDTNTAASSAINLTGSLYIDFTVSTSAGSATNSFTQQIGTAEPSSAEGPAGPQGPAGPSITVGQGVISSLPSCKSTLNEIYYPTNSYYPQVNCLTGASSWTYLMDGKQVTPPTAAITWTTINGNSGTGALSNSNGAVVFATAADVLGIEGFVKATPSTPYSILMTVRFVAALSSTFSGGELAYCGVGWTSGTATSSAFQFTRIAAYNDATSAGIFRMDSVSYTNATYSGTATQYALDQPVGAQPSASLYFILNDDGTNRWTQFSNDGINFITVQPKAARTSPFTPTDFGAFCGHQNANAGEPYSLTLLSSSN